jgi:hypothetical protein
MPRLRAIHGCPSSAVPATSRTLADREDVRTSSRLRRGSARVFLLLATLGGSIAAAEDASLRVVTVVGRAELRRTATASWSPAVLRAHIEPGGAARTSLGRLSLLTATGETLRLSGSAAIDVVVDTDLGMHVRWVAGSLWAAAASSQSSGRLHVEAGPVVVSVRDGGVGIAAGADQSIVIRAYHGSAECAGTSSGQPWSRSLAEGQELSVSGTGSPSKVHALERHTSEADWVKWNEDQDLAGGYGGARAKH